MLSYRLTAPLLLALVLGCIFPHPAAAGEPDPTHTLQQLFKAQVQADAGAMEALFASSEQLQFRIMASRFRPGSAAALVELLQEQLGQPKMSSVENAVQEQDGSSAVIEGDWVQVWERGSEYEQVTFAARFRLLRTDGGWVIQGVELLDFTGEETTKPPFPKPWKVYENQYFQMQYPVLWPHEEQGELKVAGSLAHYEQVRLYSNGHFTALHVEVQPLQHGSAEEAAAFDQEQAERYDREFQLIEQLDTVIHGTAVPGYWYSWQAMDETWQQMRYFLASEEYLLIVFARVEEDQADLQRQRLETLVSTVVLK